ncbi:MAG TPA: hypothetical protein VK670_09535 [Silvibacterium sp.]|nr:hypothetical protein [Silvibacterium sp.]
MNTNSPAILIVSRDDDRAFTLTCRRALEAEGYRTYHAQSLGLAVDRAFMYRPELIVLDPSFTDIEQTAFIDCLHETDPAIQILCLRCPIPPRTLLRECKSILTAHPGSENVHGFEYARAS